MKQQRRTQPIRIVSVNDEEVFLELVETIASKHFKGVTVQSFQDAEQAWQELSRTDPDLLITDDLMGKLNGDEIVRRLAEKKVAYPIIVINAFGSSRDQWVSDYAKRGVNVTMLSAPYEVESLVRALESALRISRDATGPVQNTTKPKTRPPRIVMVNTELSPLKACETVIRSWYKDAELVLFEHSTAAWEELSQTDPDLLITGTWFPVLRGKELVERLIDRKAAYPIIVMSAYEPEELWVEEYASRGIDIKFLSMPFDVAAFRDLVSGSLNIPPDKNHN